MSIISSYDLICDPPGSGRPCAAALPPWLLMARVASFGAVVLAAEAVIIVAAPSSRVSERLRIPAPAFFLLTAASASNFWPQLASLSRVTVEDAVTVVLALILFDGGMHIGWGRFRSVAVATAWVGVAGTFATAAAAGVAAHFLLSAARPRRRRSPPGPSPPRRLGRPRVPG